MSGLERLINDGILLGGEIESIINGKMTHELNSIGKEKLNSIVERSLYSFEAVINSFPEYITYLSEEQIKIIEIFFQKEPDKFYKMFNIFERGEGAKTRDFIKYFKGLTSPEDILLNPDIDDNTWEHFYNFLKRSKLLLSQECITGEEIKIPLERMDKLFRQINDVKSLQQLGNFNLLQQLAEKYEPEFNKRGNLPPNIIKAYRKKDELLARKTSYKGIYEIDVDGKNGKMRNPDYLITILGREIINYSRIFLDPNHNIFLEKAGINEQKDPEGIFSFYQYDGKEISSSEGYIRLSIEKFLFENKLDENLRETFKENGIIPISLNTDRKCNDILNFEFYDTKKGTLKVVPLKDKNELYDKLKEYINPNI